MEVLTKDDVNRRMHALLDRYESQAQMARVIGVSKSQLSQALLGKIPAPPALLAALKISRAPVSLSAQRVSAKYIA